MARIEAAESNWVDQLPWIMLGLRVAVKDDLGASAAEMVYGETLAVLGDVIQTDGPQEPTNLHLQQLRRRVADLRPIPTSAHIMKSGNVHVPSDLLSAEYVFIRQDKVKRPLQQPYKGPFRVLAKADKYFKVLIGDREDTVSMD